MQCRPGTLYRTSAPIVGRVSFACAARGRGDQILSENPNRGPAPPATHAVSGNSRWGSDGPDPHPEFRGAANELQPLALETPSPQEFTAPITERCNV